MTSYFASERNSRARRRSRKPLRTSEQFASPMEQRSVHSKMRESSDTEEIIRALRRILRRVSTSSRLLAKSTGLSVPELLCLRAVGRRTPEEATLAVLADDIQLSRSTTSNLIDRLVRAELLSRTRSERDRRRVFLELTALGRSRIQTTPTPLQENVQQRLGAASPEERSEIHRALIRLCDLMDASEIDASPVLIADEKMPSSDA